MKRSFGRALLRLCFILGGLLSAVLVVAATFVWWITVHPHDAYRLAERYLLPKDLKLSWRAVHFVPRRITWTHWAVDWKVDGLRVTKLTPRFDVPIEELALTFEASVWSPRTHADFAKVLVRAPERVLIELSGDDAEDSARPQNPFEMIKAYVDKLAVGARYLSVEAVSIDLGKIVLIRPHGDTKLAFSLTKPLPGRDPWVVGFSLAAGSNQMSFGVKGEADVGHINTAEPFLSVLTTFEGPGVRTGGELFARFADDKLSATITGDLSYQLKAETIKTKPSLNIVVDAGRADVTLTTPVAGIPGPLKTVSPLTAHLVVPFESGRAWAKAPSQFEAAAPLDLFFVTKETRAALEGSCACRVPERLRVDLKGNLWLDAIINGGRARRPVADLRLEAENVTNKLFSLNLAAGLKAFSENGVYTFEPQLDSEAHLRSYRGLRNILDAHNVLIPAPFDVLDGTVDVVAHGPLERDEQGSRTPIEIKMALASEHQKIAMSSTVTLALASTFKSLDVYIKLLIENFTVQLPPLEPLAGLPPVAGDQRVKMHPPKPGVPEPPPARRAKADGFRMQVFFSVKTASPGAIKLLSQLAKPAVPISVNVDRAANGDLTGQVALEPFSITYLRRTVRVEQMRVLMDERDPANFPVDGRIRLDQTQYKVFVDVSGTVRSPSIRLSSEPYLPRPEIISVLLYDRTSDRLAGGDAETAGSFEAAMADRAIGLFGLWAFASTPIKSFSYNPVTRVYSATVQLADGLTAGVGTNWEEAASFEVRKRVSRRWVLTASWSPSETTKDQVGKLVLQWEKRF